ncbi:protein-disulfide reductase DsbD family protein [Wolbachia endosymbiont of Ctenocephalides felis wCfeJ]|uniref:protein-disulfide reductase DsbD family protein n=1 Tax=Wolbachia endosymbiont of Ctenocephalides felis wCfeJ TaxID=2732594 RepID=UPI001444FBE9|nr:thioredoxin family protein [Wolbachia endosymbiont of Ctenocephalides felis wCfeJ]
MEPIINLVFAFIGGVILNFMPCVLPVLSLKVVAMINDASNSFKLRLNGITYTLGVLTTMLILSIALLTLRNMGCAVGWGFHMQSPVFILVLVYVMFAVGLCFCGLYEIPFIFSYSGKANSSFFTGVLTTLVATPCVTPFMASAICFALTQSSIFIFISIFLFLGLGISFPYLIISFFPNKLKFLPKPGKWMETFKHFLSFPIFLSTIWLFWVLIKESNMEMVLPVLVGLLSFTFSIWIWSFTSYVKLLTKSILFILLLLLNLLPFVLSESVQRVIFQENLQAERINFSQERLTSLIDDGQSVLVTISADWCLYCKFLNQVVLKSDPVQQLLKAHNVVCMEGDWTNRDPYIANYMRKFKGDGLLGVPFFGLHTPNNREGKFFRDISKEILESMLNTN